MGNPTHSNIHGTNAWGHWAQIFELWPRGWVTLSTIAKTFV